MFEVSYKKFNRISISLVSRYLQEEDGYNIYLVITRLYNYCLIQSLVILVKDYPL